MYDVIGDLHGHARELIALLEHLGYRLRDGVFRHPKRQVIFLGDFIDRGPDILSTVAIVRSMVESGVALAVLGNHEINALAYHTPDPDHHGHHLRRHTTKNQRQHQATIDQLGPRELHSALDWFRTLPLWLDLDGVRAVHACWDESAQATLRQGLLDHDRLSAEFLQRAFKSSDPLHRAIEVTLKGKELRLPAGMVVLDKDGHPRDAIRTRWYLSPVGRTYAEYALQSHPIDLDHPLQGEIFNVAAPYPPEAKPVFVGHYWMMASRPSRLAPNVACLDYSVAKDGFLCSYRWDGEAVLEDDHFVWLPRSA